MNFKYRLTNIGNSIYLLEFNDSYDLAMSFLRLQEFYESENDQFRGQKFNLLDYIEWYSKKNGNKFTYAADWSGFNIPSVVFHQLYKDNIADMNRYDYFMKGVYDFINRHEKGQYYLIGTATDDKDTLEHEYAHALFSLNKEYKEEQIVNISMLDKADELVKIIEDMGYSGDTALDEVHAYMATSDLLEEFKKVLGKKYSVYREPFIYTLEKYSCLNG